MSLVSVVGVDRAVDSAVRCLPSEKLEQSLPYLQWLALHRRIKRQVEGGKIAVTYLRESLAEAIGVPVPSFRSPVRPATLGMLLAGGVAVYLLLPQLSSMSDVVDSMAHASWAWLAVATATGLLAIVASAYTLLGSTSLHLPVGKTVAVQVAAAFTGRTTAAGDGVYGVNLVFLERLGLRRAHAVGVIVVNRVAMGVVSAVLTGLGVLVIGNAVPIGDISLPTSLPVLAGIGACWSPRPRRSPRRTGGARCGGRWGTAPGDDPGAAAGAAASGEDRRAVRGRRGVPGAVGLRPGGHPDRVRGRLRGAAG